MMNIRTCNLHHDHVSWTDMLLINSDSNLHQASHNFKRRQLIWRFVIKLDIIQYAKLKIKKENCGLAATTHPILLLVLERMTADNIQFPCYGYYQSLIPQLSLKFGKIG